MVLTQQSHLHDGITAEEREIIIHAKKSCLHNSGEFWGKRSSPNLFDVTMGSYDGAETCELIGTFLLNHITSKHGNNFGLYRDDGLGVMNASACVIENVKKDLCSIFNQLGLKITIEAIEASHLVNTNCTPNQIISHSMCVVSPTTRQT